MRRWRRINNSDRKKLNTGKAWTVIRGLHDKNFDIRKHKYITIKKS